MKRNRKLVKVAVVLVLIALQVSVHAIQIMAEASSDSYDNISSPNFTVGTLQDFVDAVVIAVNGDTIGITSEITIDKYTEPLSNDDSGKHINVIRMNKDAYFNITQEGILVMNNTTFDGCGSQFESDYPMFYDRGSLVLENSTIQNCSASGQGGAVCLDGNGSLSGSNIVFDNNTAYQGGHIYAHGYLNLTNCILKNGKAVIDGGAVKICQGYNVSLSLCKIYGNSAGEYGGGVSNSGTADFTTSIFYNNTAPSGSDISNDMTATVQLGELEDLEYIYETEGIKPIEWIKDCNELTDTIYNTFDVSDSKSLMKLIYESINGSDDENNETNSETIETPTDDDSSVQENDTDETPTTDDSSEEVSEPSETESIGESVAETETETSTYDIIQTNEAAGGSDKNTPSSYTTSETYEDKSTTTTNNYYTYNTSPAISDKDKQDNEVPETQTTAKNEDSASTSVSQSSIKADTGVYTGISSSIQSADTIKLDLSDVDIVYEMKDGVASLEISNGEDKTYDMGYSIDESVTALSDMTISGSVDTEKSVNWYEVAEMIILAAIFIVVIPKPVKTSGTRKLKKYSKRKKHNK